MDKTELSSTIYISFSEQISSFLSTGFENQKSLAFWRMPAQENIDGCMGSNLDNYLSPILSQQSAAGFAFHPFDVSGQSAKPHFIKNEISMDCFKEALEMKELPINFLKSGISSISKNSQLSVKNIPNNYLSTPISQQTASNFKEKVEDAVKSIENGLFHKVVLSDAKSIESVDLELGKIFIKACSIYPNAFVSLVAIPNVGIWIGASPELLVSYSQDQVFQTIALAGTKSAESATELKNIPWTHKEIEEQAFVSRYIVNCFKKIRVREYEESGPKTVLAGPLVHLRTDFSIDNKLVNYPELPEVLLGLLHPTSAVCGMPKESALDFIAKNENFSRKYFSGFLGPVSYTQGSSLFVNIRCIEITNEGANLYAGAGITETSNPENEAKEIELKMQVMGKLLR